MHNYLILVNWTDQGAHDFPNTLQDAKLATEAFEGSGGTLVNVYWTMGRYDLVMVTRFPDDVAAAAAVLRVNGEGRLRTEILPAFDQAQIAAVLG